MKMFLGIPFSLAILTVVLTNSSGLNALPLETTQPDEIIYFDSLVNIDQTNTGNDSYSREAIPTGSIEGASIMEAVSSHEDINSGIHAVVAEIIGEDAKGSIPVAKCKNITMDATEVSIGKIDMDKFKTATTPPTDEIVHLYSDPTFLLYLIFAILVSVMILYSIRKPALAARKHRYVPSSQYRGNLSQEKLLPPVFTIQSTVPMYNSTGLLSLLR